MRNLAFVDGQNLHLGTKDECWSVDHRRLRTYLKDKYDVDEAYYYLGFVSEEQQHLYEGLQRAGFILSFREHSLALKGRKKGNVDCDIVFDVMRKLVEGEDFDKVLLISGDGDYKKLVDFLLKRKKFKKILFPNKEFASSLYKKLGGEYYDYLGSSDVRTKIEYKSGALNKKRAP